jgi:hypothetical protein
MVGPVWAGPINHDRLNAVPYIFARSGGIAAGRGLDREEVEWIRDTVVPHILGGPETPFPPKDRLEA